VSVNEHNVLQTVAVTFLFHSVINTLVFVLGK